MYEFIDVSIISSERLIVWIICRQSLTPVRSGSRGKMFI